MFETKQLPKAADLIAPDGSDVRLLLQLVGGSMAHFQLAPGRTSIAMVHRTVEEIWFFLGGRGEMWRKLREHAEVISLAAGTCITIPVGTCFQFRSLGPEPLAAVAISMPPWPGEGEAQRVKGLW
jgi:mannose-6-phosphate isomerase-like protein (cupin superfamily)